jgi:transcriptional regulator with XRE-family HTH domain
MNQKDKALYKAIGKLVSVRRDRLDLNQEELARRVGVSRATLASIETGRQGVLVHQLYELAKQLDLPSSDLLPPVPDKRTASKSEALPMPENLNDQQIAEVNLLLGGAPVQSEQQKEKNRVKKTKRTSS